MPPLEEADHYDDVVIWEATGAHDLHGDYVVNAPRQITARWEETKRGGTDSQGNTVTFDGTVFINERVPLGSKLWQGLLEDLPDPVDEDLCEVVAYNEVTSLKGRFTQRDCLIMRYRGSLPGEVGTGT